MTTDTFTSPATRVHGALAMELSPGSQPLRDALPQERAGEVAALLARDLAGQHHAVARLQLATVMAHYDPVELLRPGWPLHAGLQQLGARAPASDGARGADGGRIVAFGAHDGHLPDVLAPSPEFRGGLLRLLPFVLSGEPATVTAVAEAFEAGLMERGMAAADTALTLQEAFGLRIEHARYLTGHDLLAMTALQYEHAGLASLWPLLETALLAPDGEAWLDAPPEPLLHYAGGEVRIALFSTDGWRRRFAAGDDDAVRLARAHARFEARQRQLASVLQAHGIAVTFAYCHGGEAEFQGSSDKVHPWT
ncbi:MAG: hypothetical protein M3485_04055 [Pseudomonadota bacterium]|nr:hypothetical protein [Pseudomonadota bacterium]